MAVRSGSATASPVPRIAILGFALEANRWSPVSMRDDFESQVHLAGDAIMADLAQEFPAAPGNVRAFRDAMDRSGPWTPVPVLLTWAPPGGPADGDFFADVLREMRDRLADAVPLDGVYVSAHGAGLAVGDDDADGTVLELVRTAVGLDVPIVVTLDLHGNVSPTMAQQADVMISYLTNPHVDMVDRGREAAGVMLAMLDGARPQMVHVKVPMITPSVSLLTGSGPYGELIDRGQRRLTPEILNVSVLAGFAPADSPHGGMSILVTALRDRDAALALATDLAEGAWADRHRYVPRLTSIEAAVAMATECGCDPLRPAVLLADVADNPGGGGRGNTTEILEAMHGAGVEGAVVGMIVDPPLADEAHAVGEGGEFTARFNRDEQQEGSGRFSADAQVVKLADGPCVGRRGIYADMTVDLGPTAVLRLGGIDVIVASRRHQLADPTFVERLGIDLADVRTLVVKSRGHFRAGFDEFFTDRQIVEVDAQGLTTPVLSRLPFTRLPRPIYPLDPDMAWPADRHSLDPNPTN